MCQCAAPLIAVYLPMESRAYSNQTLFMLALRPPRDQLKGDRINPSECQGPGGLSLVDCWRQADWPTILSPRLHSHHIPLGSNCLTGSSVDITLIVVQRQGSDAGHFGSVHVALI